jgi:hypothetical protein
MGKLNGLGKNISPGLEYTHVYHLPVSFSLLPAISFAVDNSTSRMF